MLTIENASLHYGAAQALRGVSLQVEPKSITCILGRNGVGKTSMLRAIVGQHPLSSGSISFEGSVLGRKPPYDRARAGIAFVPQGREIFPLLTVRENLATGFAAATRGNRNVPPEVFELFPVLKTMLGRRGGDLSGGQQQQLAIGRALVTRPKLLVLDEPTEGIQPSIIKDIGRAIQFLRDQAGLAILLVEQYLDFCRELADHVYIMDRGEIVHSGNAASLDRPEVRKFLTV
ncbi:urea transport system ATP-binding protein [Phyllobacterium sp. 1468]|uniref:urea ABC transporter ATP-binding subunit UrtE n=1 Tax=Phyllobacterium sp. 1468 TaxID=2817759 RepID=UPI00285EC07C|nr:urea ABC transporter ATP-binding subunit UrtE [Phyllobacterium sp. 1468]MDR6633511.1 urea transport system ATP-binding protein [Phyllobacterium sp. 1468]